MKRLIFTMESVGNNCFQNKSNQSFKIGLQIIKPNDIFELRDSNYSGFKFDLFVNEIKISGFKYDIAGKSFLVTIWIILFSLNYQKSESKFTITYMLRISY